MGMPNVLEKVADKIPAMVAKDGVAAVAAKFKVSHNAIYYRLGKSGKKVTKKKVKKTAKK